MAPDPLAEQGTLRWARVLDLSATPMGGGARPISASIARLDREREVTIRFGDRRPEDLDPRISFLLAEALQAGIDVTIEGAAIGSWWHTIQDILRSLPSPTRQPRSRRRHLAVVEP